MNRALQFMQAREPFEVQALRGLFKLSGPAKDIPPMPPVSKAPWFLAVYSRDVVGRIQETKAKIKSTFGTVLKMDSTKKVLDKCKMDNLILINTLSIF